MTERNLSAERTMEAEALTAIAVADGFIASFHEKYRSNLLRPVTYINRYLDRKWQPLLITPSFPTYTSAHSTQSKAAATVLTALFGDNRPYDDGTHITLGHPLRHLLSFQAAADEAGVSRIYGGIHFPFDNTAGRPWAHASAESSWCTPGPGPRVRVKTPRPRGWTAARRHR